MNILDHITNKVIITWGMDNISKDFFDLLNRIVCVLCQEVNIQSWAAAEISQAVDQEATLEDKAVLERGFVKGIFCAENGTGIRLCSIVVSLCSFFIA